MNPKEVKPVIPDNLGWLEGRLNEKEMDYVWRCIENKKQNHSKYLAGNITGSYTLVDRADWFYMNTLKPLCTVYSEKFRNLGKRVPIHPPARHPYFMMNWWVNFQNQNEFNPNHDHDGIYSFVIFVKIPEGASYTKQKRMKMSSQTNAPLSGVFELSYTNTLGSIKSYPYYLEPSDNGTILFFPSQYRHCVYPFSNCDEERITVSGNIGINIAKRIY